MSCDGTLVEAPPAQHNNNNNTTEPLTPLQPKIGHSQVSGGLGRTTLNPEASVFQLPPSAHGQLSPPSTPAQTTATHINGFTHHVYPFMNGDVGKQYCGVCPPTPDTPRSLAVDASPESALLTSSVTSTPLNISAKTLASSSVFTTPPSDMASSSSPVSNDDHPQNASKQVLLQTSIDTCQQNGELELETTDIFTNTSVTSIPDDCNPLNTTTEIDVVTIDDEVDSGLVVTNTTSLPPETPPLTETTPATPQTETDPAPEALGTETAPDNATEDASSSIVPECDDGDIQKDAPDKEEAEEVDEANNETQGTQTTPAQSPAPNQPAPEPMTRDQIKALVAQQVEFFFSRENLSNDPYLISQMDSDQYVPVFILAGCSQFKSITKDHSIIVEALKESPFVQLDEEKNRVRPNYKRCIVILREIPESTPVEEIEAMFKGEECPKLVSCEFVHNSSWYVTFESDEDAQKAYWYLRGVVKTFKDKPILARIKTKPISRLGCLSVLPSYGGKGPGDSKDQPRPPSTPGPGGSQGGPPAPTPPQPGTPATPAPPTSQQYNPRAPPFMYPAPPSSVNGPTYSYSYPTAATNAMPPTAYFYPNMPVWTAPGGFYDINSFLQFNGLSPQAAFKPPPTPHNQGRFNGRRNSKHGRQNDTRQQQNNGGYNGTSVGHTGYHHNQRSHSHSSGHSRPQSAQSPSAGPPAQGHQAHRSNSSSSQGAAAVAAHPQPTATVATTTTTTTTAASVQQQTSSPAVSTIPAANNHNFAQCDLALASQSNLYTSFSPPVDAAAPLNSSIRTDGNETVAVKATPQSNSSSNTNSSSSTPPVCTALGSAASNTNFSPTAASSSSMLNTPIAAASIAGAAASSSQTVVTPAMPPTQISSQIPPSQQQLQHQQQLQQQQQYPAGPPPPPPHHRNAYQDYHPHHPGPHPHYPHHPMQRDQHPRQLSRGGGGRGRRRPREEEEMMGMGPGGRGRGQGPRGPPMQPPGSNDMANKSQQPQLGPDSLMHPQTHFDLEATAFPPLPGASPEEPKPTVPVAEEQRPVEPAPSAWGSGDSQRFSDVMKGTAKPRPQSHPSQTSSPGEPIIEIPSPTGLISPACTTSFGFSHSIVTSGAVVQATSPPSTPAAVVVSPTQTAAPPPPPTAAAIVATPPPPTSQSNTGNTNSPVSQDTISSSAAGPTNTQQTSASLSSSSSSSIASNSNTCISSGNNAVNKLDTRNSQRNVYSRDERRSGAVGGPRGDRREHPRDIRGPRDHRNVRDNIRGAGKENRPMPSRPWKEDRVDADGWITKGSRAQRDTNREQQQQQPSQPQYNQRDKVDSREVRSSHLVNGDTTPPPSPKPQKIEKTKDDTPAAEDQKMSTSQPLNNNDGEHKPSWAMMAKQSKESMERLSSELKEKEEQEKIKKLRLNTRPQMKPQDYIPQREGKPLRRDGPQRENRQSSERGGVAFRPRDSARPKSPK